MAFFSKDEFPKNTHHLNESKLKYGDHYSSERVLFSNAWLHCDRA